MSMKHLRTLLVMILAIVCGSVFAQINIEPGTTAVQSLELGSEYTFKGYEDYYVSPSFFTSLGEGKYRFNAITGTYLIEAQDHKYLQVRSCSSDGTLASLQNDGTGAIYMIGDGIGLPNITKNSVGWNPGYGVSMAQTSAKHYELTGVIGSEYGTTIGFQFYGQNQWWPKVCGSDGQTYHCTSSSDLIAIGKGETVDGHDDGTLYYKDGASIQSGDTLTIYLDCSEGIGNIKLTTSLKKAQTTGIKDISSIPTNGEKWYSLDGKCLPAQPKSHGIFIHNGKKIVK